MRYAPLTVRQTLFRVAALAMACQGLPFAMYGMAIRSANLIWVAVVIMALGFGLLGYQSTLGWHWFRRPAEPGLTRE